MVKPSLPTLLFVVLSPFSAAFRAQQPPFVARQLSTLKMETVEATETVKVADPAPPASEPAGKLIPIKEETVQFTAGLLGGVAGFAIGGPVLAAIGAAIANYVSKLGGDNEASTIVGAVSKTSLEVYNYLAKVDTKYELVSKAQASLENSLKKLKESDSVDPETVQKVETALASTTSKLKEINEEYDLVGAGVTALGVVGDLVEKAVTKAGELNEEYKLSDKALAAVKEAVEKAKTAATT
jgi:hypothetical protein